MYVRVAQQEYTSFRSVLTAADPSGISLDRIGPLVTFTALIQNSIFGATFPRSTLTIHLPTEVKTTGPDDQDRYTPILVPTSIVVGAGVDSVNCSHYQSISKFLVREINNHCCSMLHWDTTLSGKSHFHFIRISHAITHFKCIKPTCARCPHFYAFIFHYLIS